MGAPKQVAEGNLKRRVDQVNEMVNKARKKGKKDGESEEEWF
jgi:hypothetical protein